MSEDDTIYTPFSYTNYVNINSLPMLKSNSFVINNIPATQFTKIVPPSISVVKLSNILVSGSIQTISKIYRCYLGTGVVAPSWLSVGINVTFQGTSSNATFNQVLDQLNGATVSNIDPVAGNYVDITCNNYPNITTPLNQDTLLSGSISLVIQCQKAIFATPASNSDTVLISDSADFNGANQGWNQAIPAGNPGYSVDAVSGFKFNLADWYVKSNTGTQSIMIKFF